MRSRGWWSREPVGVGHKPPLWNSVLESLSNGVPIIRWPLGAEQFYNVKMLAEEWGVCVELARGNIESSVDAVKRSNEAKVLETVRGTHQSRQRCGGGSRRSRRC
ncbi:hypothetical protein PR202_gb11753 [Eleusine coracana subsp. coracana]|uniref:Uncharacterized protein n=1 Tax=Eleusine coracana subsp. coracana TaxID=191504 RepID=A0AAV5EL11_ELECO|nr:hypothetical protein PR202_gb11753 [Eleusine coracana subsp. coracana]